MLLLCCVVVLCLLCYTHVVVFCAVSQCAYFKTCMLKQTVILLQGLTLTVASVTYVRKTGALN